MKKVVFLCVCVGMFAKISQMVSERFGAGFKEGFSIGCEIMDRSPTLPRDEKKEFRGMVSPTFSNYLNSLFSYIRYIQY